MTNKKLKTKKPFKTNFEYRTSQERKEEIHNIILKLNELKLNNNYEPIKELYNLFKIYIENGDRLIINIPFIEINKRIEGVLAINKNEEVTIRLKHEKFN